jgi:gamma-glutamylcyclotransferase (GGCT)/AIG2-like uncharacterized protein YtfP
VGVTYFAYGANMAEGVMGAFCPGHRLLGRAELPDHRLAFSRRSVRTGTGVADVVPASGRSVWGVLYEVDDSDLDALDRKEGNGWAYDRSEVAVRAAGREPGVSAVTYCVREREAAEVTPSRAYVEGLIQAARDRGLPATYVAELEARRPQS